MSLLEDLFDAYRDSLRRARPSRAREADDMLCPLCLVPISRIEIVGTKFPIEHIVPQHSTAAAMQPTPATAIATKGARSGLTITCRSCNAHKGRRLDWVMRNRITPSLRAANDYKFEAGTAILCYAYLLAFAHFGYGYVLDSSLDSVRAQISNPSSRHSKWLVHACVDLGLAASPIVCNELGYPVAFRLAPPPLEVRFWRFTALLPALRQSDAFVAIPQSVIALAE